MTEEGSSTDVTSSSSEDEEPYIDETNDKFFFRTLSYLKNNDPKIYDPKEVFFPKQGEINNSTKKTQIPKEPTSVYIRDYERDIVMKAMNKEDIDGNNLQHPLLETNLPYAVQLKSLKESFKTALLDSEDEGDLLTIKESTNVESPKEEGKANYKTWFKANTNDPEEKRVENDLKSLHDFWSKPDLDKNEEFLRDYILNRKYLEEDSEHSDDGISEDGEILDIQEKFEADYNMRNVQNDCAEVKRYPRVIEGCLRRKNEGRKLKREERKTRKRIEKERKKDQISVKQQQKLREFKEHLEKIKAITSNDRLGFLDKDIFGDEDFDPENHDMQMSKQYGDEFYSLGEKEGGKPVFTQTDDIKDWLNQDGGENGNPDNMDLDPYNKPRKETRSKRKRQGKKKTFSDIMDVTKPIFDPQIHSSFQNYIDDYYKMDCEDFIDDIPCKFKYRDVVPNDYGLTIEEILAADDKELNRWVSTKKISKLRPEHVERNEVKIYKKKGQDIELKKKLLPSVFEPQQTDDSLDIEANVSGIQTDDFQKSESNIINDKDVKYGELSKKAKMCLTDNKKTRKCLLNIGVLSNRSSAKKTEKKNHDVVSGVTDHRLKAYDIKPRAFRKKNKFKK